MVLPLGSSKSAGDGQLQIVQIFALQHRKGERHKRPWIARWSVDGAHRSRSFRTKAEADRFRTMLLNGQQRGERFDGGVGLPVSLVAQQRDLQVHVWVRQWLAEQWPEWQPRTRFSAVEALSRFVAACGTGSSAPEELRAHLRATLPPGALIDPDDERERWLAGSMPELHELTRESLARVDVALGIGDQGQTLAASTAGRFRKVARSCVRRAVDLEVLESDPWPPVPRGRARRKSVRIQRGVDVRVLPNPQAMATAIAAMKSAHPASETYRVMTAVAYYAGLRPSEVVMLRASALTLPETGWGRIDVVEADISFDESGDPKTGPRSVPIPPTLVTTLRTWVTAGGYAPTQLLFRTRNGKRPTHSNWSRAFKRALASVGMPALRVYDCRHAAATTWLRAGVPLAETARRLGHSVETLVTMYVGALDGDEALANTRIESEIA